MRHDADAISQFVGLFDMLSAHNNGSALLECADQVPHLLA
jgi:hypothetical protein